MTMEDVLTEQVFAALAKVKPGAGEGLTTERTLESLGLDSLDTITLLFELEDRVGVSIPDQEARSARTVGDVIACIRRLKDVVTADP
jgi:acyl carrier protein